MTRAYVLIGGSRTRKSTLLRCLTGCFNRSVRDIETVHGQSIKLYARVSALQESRTDVRDLVQEVARSRCEHVLFALWPQSNPVDPQRLPDAHSYLESLQAQGWRFDKVAVLGADPIRPRVGGEVARFPNVLHQAVNTTAQQLRQHFEWR
jgi:hypothetical protein